MNYSAWESGGPFSGLELTRGPQGEVSFEIRQDGTWYGVLTNEEGLVNTQVVQVRASLYQHMDDVDGDTVPNDSDNCVDTPNGTQDDGDGDDGATHGFS